MSAKYSFYHAAIFSKPGCTNGDSFKHFYCKIKGNNIRKIKKAGVWEIRRRSRILPIFLTVQKGIKWEPLPEEYVNDIEGQLLKKEKLQLVLA